MDAAAATALLERLVQPDVTPTLTDPEMTSLLADAAVIDADGYAPGDAEWTATYRRGTVYAAAVAGLDLKILKAAPTAIDTDIDGLNERSSQLVAHLRATQREYQRRAGGATAIKTTWVNAGAESHVANWNDPDAEP